MKQMSCYMVIVNNIIEDADILCMHLFIGTEVIYMYVFMQLFIFMQVLWLYLIIYFY